MCDRQNASVSCFCPPPTKINISSTFPSQATRSYAYLSNYQDLSQHKPSFPHFANKEISLCIHPRTPFALPPALHAPFLMSGRCAPPYPPRPEKRSCRCSVGVTGRRNAPHAEKHVGSRR